MARLELHGLAKLGSTQKIAYRIPKGIIKALVRLPPEALFFQIGVIFRLVLEFHYRCTERRYGLGFSRPLILDRDTQFHLGEHLTWGSCRQAETENKHPQRIISRSRVRGRHPCRLEGIFEGFVNDHCRLSVQEKIGPNQEGLRVSASIHHVADIEFDGARKSLRLDLLDHLDLNCVFRRLDGLFLITLRGDGCEYQICQSDCNACHDESLSHGGSSS